MMLDRKGPCERPAKGAALRKGLARAEKRLSTRNWQFGTKKIYSSTVVQDALRNLIGPAHVLHGSSTQRLERLQIPVSRSTQKCCHTYKATLSLSDADLQRSTEAALTYASRYHKLQYSKFINVRLHRNIFCLLLTVHEQ
jgi:hypothetical protein